MLEFLASPPAVVSSPLGNEVSGAAENLLAQLEKKSLFTTCIQ